MKHEIFAVFDMAVEAFMEPWPSPTVAFAIRSFGEACAKEGHQMQKHPEDYCLYHVGTFEDGVLQGFEPRKIAMASSYAMGPQLTLDDQLGEQA